MKNKQIILNPIGIIHTPFNSIKNMPIQPIAAENIKGYIEIFPEYTAGLTHLEGFSHIILLYHFHEIKGFDLMVTPFLDTKEHGLFSTRSPRRPNAVGISTVKLLGIEDNIIHIEMADMLNQTPLIDIKPYVEKFDCYTGTTSGWIENNSTETIKKMRSDERFKN